MEISNNFDTFGLPAGVKATKGTTLQHLGYVFDPKTGNMTSRSDQRRNITETFEYDNLDRLLSCSTMGNDTYTEYSANGNIKSTNSMGEYRYGISGKPYAVSGIENIANAVPNHTQTISYTSFKRPEQIIQNNNSLTYTYNSAGHRAKAVAVENGSTTTTYTFGGGKYEKITGSSGTKERLYVGGSPYNAPLLVEKAGGTTTHYYLHRDCLGSITAITNQGGTIEAEYSYTAWGLLRNPANWQVYAAGNEPALMFGRGYTGHAHLPQFGLINMNARLYDPALCRFLSPDPYVQMPDFTQSFNRYSYCVNNPLSYVDPSGEIVWFVPVIIGAVIGGTSGAIMAHQSGAQGFREWAGYVGGGALIGGLSGGTASGVSALGGAAWWAGAAAGAVGGTGFSGLATNWNGEAMLKGAAFGATSGFVGGGIGSAIGGGWGAVAGGASSSGINTALNGGDLEQIGVSMLIGGALSYGTYELTSYISFKQSNLTINNHQVTYKQFKTMQADYQRSRFWRKEYGGILTKNGNVIRAPSQNRHSLRVDFTRGMVNVANNDGGSAASYHTHWARGGVDYYVNNVDDIVSKANALSLVTTSNGPSPGDMNGLANYFGGNQYLIDKNSFYYYNTETSGNNSAFLFRYFPMYWW